MNRFSARQPLFVTIFAVLALLVTDLFAQQPSVLKSPNGRLALTLSAAAGADGQAFPTYQVAYDGKTVVEQSRFRFLVEGGDSKTASEFCQGLTQSTQSKVSEHDSRWKPVYGERSTVHDHYHGFDVTFRNPNDADRQLNIECRAYDAGVAFRMTLKNGDQKSVRVSAELTEFTLPADHAAWVSRTAQGEYKQVTVSTLGKDVERPLTLRDDRNEDQPVYLAIAEAALVDYARMKLRRSVDNPLKIVSDLASKVELASPATTPWRVIMAADLPGQLVENNDIILNLNPPCAIEDTSWIKPGKVIRDITLTDAGAEACIEFAKKHNMQFVEFDAGWYGHEYDAASDATTITVDPKRSDGPLDLKRHIKAANEAGLGVILYVNRLALEKQLDEVLPLLKSWGVAGVKYGFVQVGSQKWTRWLHEAIKKAADYELMVDVHDEYRTTGFCRTYPHLMTVEGIGGDETAPTNEQTLLQLFTRMVAGVADYKICYFDHRVEENQNHATQLAKPVIMYDAWHFLFWYDSASALHKEKMDKKGSDECVIVETPELEFWDAMPTVWDDTKVVHGKIGQHAVVARRSGHEWFIGAMNTRPIELPTKLDFLDARRTYTAHIYSHDPSLETRTHVRITRQEVTRDSVLPIKLGKNSGQAVRIVPN